MVANVDEFDNSDKGLDIGSLLRGILGGKVISRGSIGSGCSCPEGSSLEDFSDLFDLLPDELKKEINEHRKMDVFKQRVGSWNVTDIDNPVFEVTLSCKNLEWIKEIVRLKKQIQKQREILEFLENNLECGKKILSQESLSFEDLSDSFQNRVSRDAQNLLQSLERIVRIIDTHPEYFSIEWSSGRECGVSEEDLVEIKRVISKMQDNPNQWYLEGVFNSKTSLSIVVESFTKFEEFVQTGVNEELPKLIGESLVEQKVFEEELNQILEVYPDLADVEEVPIFCLTEEEFLQAIREFVDKK